MKRIMPFVLLFAAAFAVAAEPAAEAEIRTIQAQLSMIQQEQQSVFQEFQMIQELRRLNMQSESHPISYDEMVRAKQEREGRSHQYDVDLNERYRRYRDLEQQKAPLLQRLNGLLQPR